MRTRIPKKELEMLAEVPLFSGCSQSELREIACLGTPVDVAAGKILIKEQEPGREFFMVIEGEAECTVGRRRLADFGPGDFFGELALLEGGSRTATVTAKTAMRVLVLHSSEFADLIRTAPSIALKLLSNLAERLRVTNAELGI
jgi:CRP-like cAMP-binding protein